MLFLCRRDQSYFSLSQVPDLVFSSFLFLRLVFLGFSLEVTFLQHVAHDVAMGRLLIISLFLPFLSALFQLQRSYSVKVIRNSE